MTQLCYVNVFILNFNKGPNKIDSGPKAKYIYSNKNSHEKCIKAVLLQNLYHNI